MSQDPEQRLGAGLREQRVVAADCKDRDSRAGVGWGDEHGSWVSEVEAHGSGQRLQKQGAGAQAPGGLQKPWQPSCGGG